MAVKQSVATTSLVEFAAGKPTRPQMSTQSLIPSPGQVTSAPPNVTRLIGVDYQLTSVTFNLTAGTLIAPVVWPSVGFPGLLAASQRFYSSIQNGGTGTSVIPLTANLNTTAALVTGQSTQLLLLCSVQQLGIGTGGVMSSFNFTTHASSMDFNIPVAGPWFPSGVRYTSFSCTPTAEYLCNLTANNIAFTIGVAAQLYSVYMI
jgi:hypothetical protein